MSLAPEVIEIKFGGAIVLTPISIQFLKTRQIVTCVLNINGRGSGKRGRIYCAKGEVPEHYRPLTNTSTVVLLNNSKLGLLEFTVDGSINLWASADKDLFESSTNDSGMSQQHYFAYQSLTTQSATTQTQN